MKTKTKIRKGKVIANVKSRTISRDEVVSIKEKRFSKIPILMVQIKPETEPERIIPMSFAFDFHKGQMDGVAEMTKFYSELDQIQSEGNLIASHFTMEYLTAVMEWIQKNSRFLTSDLIKACHCPNRGMINRMLELFGRYAYSPLFSLGEFRVNKTVYIEGYGKCRILSVSVQKVKMKLEISDPPITILYHGGENRLEREKKFPINFTTINKDYGATGKGTLFEADSYPESEESHNPQPDSYVDTDSANQTEEPVVKYCSFGNLYDNIFGVLSEVARSLNAMKHTSLDILDRPNEYLRPHQCAISDPHGNIQFHMEKITTALTGYGYTIEEGSEFDTLTDKKYTVNYSALFDRMYPDSIMGDPTLGVPPLMLFYMISNIAWIQNLSAYHEIRDGYEDGMPTQLSAFMENINGYRYLVADENDWEDEFSEAYRTMIGGRQIRSMTEAFYNVIESSFNPTFVELERDEYPDNTRFYGISVDAVKKIYDGFKKVGIHHKDMDAFFNWVDEVTSK